MSDNDQIQLLRQVRLALQEQNYPKAIEHLKEAARLSAEAGDIGAEGRHLGNLALIYYRMQQPREALKFFNQALERARAEGDRVTEDGLLGNMGNILRELGQYDEAIAHLNQALLIANEIGDVRGRGIWLGNLGLVYDDLRQLDTAVDLHQQSIAVARQLQDQRGLASRLGNVGNSYMNQGDFIHALHAFEEAVQIYEQLGDRQTMALRMGIIGNIYNELGRTTLSPIEAQNHLRQAYRYYQQTLTIARELGDRISEAGLLRGLGNVYGNLGQYDEAIAQYNAAMQLFTELGLRDQLPPIQRSIELATSYRDQQTRSRTTP